MIVPRDPVAILADSEGDVIRRPYYYNPTIDFREVLFDKFRKLSERDEYRNMLTIIPIRYLGRVST